MKMKPWTLIKGIILQKLQKKDSAFGKPKINSDLPDSNQLSTLQSSALPTELRSVCVIWMN